MKDIYKDRFRIIQLVFVLASGILFLKALHLQLIDSTFQDKAETTAIGKHVKYPARGSIYDRRERLLINNDPMYDLMVTYNQVDPKMDTLLFCKLLGIDKEFFIDNLDRDFRRDHRYSRSKPFIFLKKVPFEVFARFQEYLHEFPGFFPQLRSVRGYPYAHGAHVLGYLNEVNQAQIDADKDNYSPGDYIGATGLEAAYEKVLRGEKGVEYVLKDNLGRVVGPYRKGSLDYAAKPGTDIITSLDIDLQTYSEQLLENKTGSIVAIEPASGEILVMASSPAYDPNQMTINRSRGKTLQALLTDSLQPLFDRTVMAQYPPGSIFKPVVALIALQEGISHADRGISCRGAYFYNSLRRGCHAHPYPANISIALQHSCNTYFFNLIRNIIDVKGFYHPEQGLDLFNSYLDKFGLGRRLGIDYPNEETGNVPTVAYYDRLYPKKLGGWKSPTIMSIGIGQGEIQLTTLQMANLAAIIANRGHYYAPHLLKGYQNRPALSLPEEFTIKREVGIDQEHFEPVIEGMARAVTGGTARVAQVPGVEVCGKTGTSENPHGEDHSVFFAFAPRDNPQIAIAVYVEHGVWGARYAAPIASLVIEKHLNRSIAQNRLYLEERMLNASLHGQP